MVEEFFFFSFNVYVFRVLLYVCLFGNFVYDLDLIFSNLN